MDLQPQIPLTRRASTIGRQRYASGERAVVSQGLVAARVRAIQGKPIQAKAPTPQSTFQEESPARKRPLNRVVRSLRSSPSFQRFNQQPTEHISTGHRKDQSVESRLSSYGKWQHSTTSLHSSHSILPTGLRPSSERKVQSMWDLHTRYSGSPHGGRKIYRDYSNLRRISDGSETVKSEILSPQPVSPYKQPVRVARGSTDNSGFWSESQGEQRHAGLIPSPGKSIAEELGEMLDVSQGQDEASTAWATEDDHPEYPFPLTKPLGDPSITEAQRSEGGVPVDRNAYSQYLRRKLPGFTQTSTASSSHTTDHGLGLRRMRSRRAVPDNTLDSVTESGEHDNVTPPLSFKRRLRASTATASHEDAPSANAPRRAIMPAPSIDPFIDHQNSEATDEGQAILQDFKAYKSMTDPQSSQQEDEITNSRADLDVERQDGNTHSRRSSATGRVSSIGISRPLSRAWRRLSTWRLGFGSRQPTSMEPSVDQSSERDRFSRTGTDLQAHSDTHSSNGSELTPPATPPAQDAGISRQYAAGGHQKESTSTATSPAQNAARSRQYEVGEPHKESTSTTTLSAQNAAKSKQYATGGHHEVSASTATPPGLDVEVPEPSAGRETHRSSQVSTSPSALKAKEAKQGVGEPHKSLEVRHGPSRILTRSADGLLVTHIENSDEAKSENHTSQVGLPTSPIAESPHTEQTELSGQWPEQSHSAPASREVSVHSVTPPARPSNPPPMSINTSRANSEKADYSSRVTRHQEQATYIISSVEHAAETPERATSTPMNSPPALLVRPRRPSPPAKPNSPLKLSPPQPTIELSTSNPVEWTPNSFPPRRGSVLSRTYNSLADRYQVHVSRASSPSPSTSTIESASASAYVSLKGSKTSLRSPPAIRPQQSVYELGSYRDKGQRIRRVKVVVSLDGGPDLVVDASIEGEGEEGWKVREEVRTRETVEG